MSNPAELPLDDRYYIVAASSFADYRTRVLKQGDTFGLFDQHGDIWPHGRGEQGLYHQDTRFLSRLTMAINEHRPMLLSSTVVDTNDLLAVNFTNPDLFADGGEGAGDPPVVPHGALHFLRTRFLHQAVAYERLRVHNHGLHRVDFRVQYGFAADYADIFEVRGIKRAGRGRTLEPEVKHDSVVLAYVGLDGVARRTRLLFSPPPTRIASDAAAYKLSLEPGATLDLVVRIACELADHVPHMELCERAAEESEDEHGSRRAQVCNIVSSNQQFNNWMARSTSDLLMLVTDTADGPYPYAGVPWYSVPFGRDGIITAYEWLWAYPELARGVLLHLARRQATQMDAPRDAEPGKILHESRGGEMAALGEVPFGSYYGTVNATPLFALLAGAYYRRTGEHSLLERIWPAVQAALGWMETFGDPDGDGFIEYQRKESSGLANQGWKDSADSVFHADGRLAEPPIALCEVQAYAYGAWRAGAFLATALGQEERATRYRTRADELKRQFDQAFWCEDLGVYAIALDRDKKPCRVRTSNAGQCLFTGIATPERAARIARELGGEAFFSNWGVRTVAAGEPRYNPMSYHNGSIWPHDNALIAAGLASTGYRAEAAHIATALFEMTPFFDLNRIPELLCGFTRRRGEGPTLYPVACSPQAWATGVPTLMLSVFLGLEVDGLRRQLRLSSPMLPPYLEWVEIENLQVGSAHVHVRFERLPHDVGVTVLSRDADVEIVIVK